MSAPYTHAADQHFESLVDYLHHLVEAHGVKETPELWRSGRERFDELHAFHHGVTLTLSSNARVRTVSNLISGDIGDGGTE